MIKYYALWLPTLKSGAITFADSPGKRRIQDNGMWKPYYLWGEVDRTNYNFTLWYSNDDNRDHANQLNLTHGGHNNHWFIIYSVQLPDEDTDDDFLNLLRSRDMTASVYHYIKDHFHKHVHHDSKEDALLICLSSEAPLTLDTEEGRRRIYTHYLDLYDRKINNFLKDAIDDHARGRNLVNNVFTAGKGISHYASTIRNGRILAGEYEYCEFLMKIYNTGRAQQNKEIRDKMVAIRKELEALSFDYQLCTNSFSIKLAVYGIIAGVAGILVSTGGIVYSCCSQTDKTPIIQHIDSATDAQKERTMKLERQLQDVSKGQKELQEQNETLKSELQEANKNIKRLQQLKNK